MSVKKTILLAFILLTCVVLPDLLLAVPATRVNGAGHRVQGSVPKITKAVKVKKVLTIEGENFAEGAKLLVNGAPVKSFNDEITPATKLVLNKANKRLPYEETVSLQVQNPDGQTSEPYGFFTGLSITYQSTQLSINVHLQVGQKFLVDFRDPTIIWSYYLPPGNSSEVIQFLASPVPLIPGAQGLYLAKNNGQALFVMEANSLIGIPPFRWPVNLYVDN
jgi:hypothetical protein